MKTKGELFEEVDEKYGIRTTANFHCDPNEELTDEEYQKNLIFIKKCLKLIGMILKMMKVTIFK